MFKKFILFYCLFSSTNFLASTNNFNEQTKDSIHFPVPTLTFDKEFIDESHTQTLNSSFKNTFYFNGKEDYIKLKKTQIDSSFTIALWIRPTDLLKKNQAIFGLDKIFLARTTTDREFQITEPSKKDNNTIGALLTNNSWVHLTLKFETNKFLVYINGQLNTQFECLRNINNTQGQLLIAKNHWREHFNGEMSAFKYWNSGLSSIDIHKNYHATRPENPIQFGLINYFSLKNSIPKKETSNLTYKNILFKYDSLQLKKSAYFNGESSFLEISNIALDNAVTVSGWINPEKIDRNFGALFSSGQAFVFGFNTSGNLIATLPQIDDIISNNSTIKANQWQHVTFSFLEGKGIWFYQNGVLVDFVPITEYNLAHKSLRIGNNLWNYFYKGSINNVILWDRILSKKEVLEVYKTNSDQLKKILEAPQQNKNWLFLTFFLIFGFGIFIYKINQHKKEISKTSHLISKAEKNAALLKKATKIVTENIENSEFDVSKFAKEMGMSKTKLYNELTSLTGNSAVVFIRSIKINKAAQLLRETDLPVKGIIFATGFESRAYFNKCFRASFGLTPVEYRKSEQTQMTKN